VDQPEAPCAPPAKGLVEVEARCVGEVRHASHLHRRFLCCLSAGTIVFPALREE
jgi:hypothetical protein